MHEIDATALERLEALTLKTARECEAIHRELCALLDQGDRKDRARFERLRREHDQLSYELAGMCDAAAALLGCSPFWLQIAFRRLARAEVA